MASIAPGILHQSVVVGGWVEDPTNGVVKLSEEVGGSSIVRTMNVSKYMTGTTVEVTLRVDGAKRPVSRITVVDTSKLYCLVLSALEPSTQQKKLDAWLEAAFDAAGVTPDDDGFHRRLQGARKSSTLDPVVVVGGLRYEQADKLRSQLRNSAGSAAYFAVREMDPATAKELGVEVPLNIDDLVYVDGYWVPPQARALFGVSARVAAAGEHLNLLFLGPSGYGKTSTAQALAQWLGLDFLIVPCGSISDVTGWFGQMQAKDGTTHFEPTKFAEKIMRGNVVVLLDEANRLESYLTNPLFNILDHNRETEVRNFKVTVGPGVIFVLSMNLGMTYSGTFVSDAAFLNRITATVEMGPAPAEVEMKILENKLSPPEKRDQAPFTAAEFVRQRVKPVDARDRMDIVTLLSKIRSVVESEQYTVDVSTRTAIKMQELISYGLDIRKAVDYTVLGPAQPEERKALTDRVGALLGVSK